MEQVQIEIIKLQEKQNQYNDERERVQDIANLIVEIGQNVNRWNTGEAKGYLDQLSAML
jgi:hypothetical protein